MAFEFFRPKRIEDGFDAEKKKEEGTGQNEEKIDEERRRFLKFGVKAAVVGAGVAVGVDKVIDLLDQNNKADKKIEKTISNQQVKKFNPDPENSPKAGIEKKRNIADDFLDAYYILSRQDKYFPAKIFRKSLLIAQQLQESDYDTDAQSKAEALGVMQNMASSINDVVAYLNKLKRKENIGYKGPEKLDKNQVEEIKRLLITKSDYSRAFGKLYLMQLYDPRYGYGIGKEQKEIKEAQKEILAAYNGGIGRIKGRRESKWPQESRDYYRRIFHIQDNVETIMRYLDENNIKYNDEIVMKIAREMKRVYGNKKKEEQIMIANIDGLRLL